MSLNTNLSDDGKVLTFSINDSVDLSKYRPMLEAANDFDKDNNVTYIVDLCNCAELRDSGLGVLLNLSRKQNKEINLINCTPEVTKRIKNSVYSSSFNLSG
ncbi:MAG: hypothetical protein D6B27_05130 [Gammaproteobacteria bacterium]|nr:MAG: hypothetical protein D6B27_05130 [Gammaproteobacteria bacterium]